MHKIYPYQNILHPYIKPAFQSRAIPFTGQNTDETAEISRIASQISKEELEKYLNELAGSKTEGRGVGQRGIETAKEYIAERFKEYGLKPVNHLGLDNYYETFSMPKYSLESIKKGQYTKGELDRFKLLPPKVETANILGMIEGTEKPDEYIIISAHYDHLGKNDYHIFPGANDNASGVVGLLEIARILSQEKAPKKSIIFAALSGEESGLYGARKLSQDIIAKGIAQKVKILNLEMLASMKGETLDIWDQDKKEVQNIVSNVIKTADHFGIKTNQIHDKAGPPADSMEFNQNKIPAVTAIWDSKLNEIYKNHPTLHTTEDTPKNANKQTLYEATRVLASAINLLANETSDKSELSFTSNRLLELNAYKQKALNLRKIV